MQVSALHLHASVCDMYTSCMQVITTYESTARLQAVACSSHTNPGKSGQRKQVHPRLMIAYINRGVTRVVRVVAAVYQPPKPNT